LPKVLQLVTLKVCENSAAVQLKTLLFDVYNFFYFVFFKKFDFDPNPEMEPDPEPDPELSEKLETDPDPDIIFSAPKHYIILYPRCSFFGSRIT